MNKKYLITGATGFIGANITRELIRQKKEVHVIVRDKNLNWRLKEVKNQLNIHQSDLLDPGIKLLIKKIKPDYIFHLAAYGVLPEDDNQERMFDINVKGTINLVNAAKQNPFTLFINSGSGVEYGIKTRPMKETDILVPINDYGVSKAAATLFCQKEAIRNNLPIITLRNFTPFGYFEEKTRLIPDVTLSAIAGKPIKVSTPTNVRDFIFIEDVVDAYIHATKIKFNPGEIFNLGSGKQHSVGEVVRLILQITKSESHVEWGAVAKQARFIEPKKWEADMSKAKKIMHWKPNNKIRESLEKNAKWLKENLKNYELNPTL